MLDQVQRGVCVVWTVDCRGRGESKVSCGLTFEWLTISGRGRLFDRPRRDSGEERRGREEEGFIEACSDMMEGKPQPRGIAMYYFQNWAVDLFVNLLKSYVNTHFAIHFELLQPVVYLTVSPVMYSRIQISQSKINRRPIELERN